MRLRTIYGLICGAIWLSQNNTAAKPRREKPLPMVKQVEAQPLLAQVDRLREAMDFLGNPLPQETLALLKAAHSTKDDAEAVLKTQAALDPLCFAFIHIRANGEASVRQGAAPPLLLQEGWRVLLVKVQNDAGLDTSLRLNSPNALPLANAPASEVSKRFLDLQVFNERPLLPTLSGLAVEYRPVQIYTRSSGELNAKLFFNVGKWNLPPSELGNKHPKGVIREWSFDKGTEGWQAQNQSTFQVKDGVLSVKTTGNDPYMGVNVSAPKGHIVVRFRAKAQSDDFGQLFWMTKRRTQPDGNHLQTFQFMANGGQWKEYAIPVALDGDLSGIRIDPGGKPGTMEFDWISVSYLDEPNKDWLELPILFRSQPSLPVAFRVRDENNKPTTAAFVIRDKWGRVYPAMSKRLAPDFFFHQQVYREDGETVRLPAGVYSVHCSRGPESVPETKTLMVGAKPTAFSYKVKRWIDPAKLGWISGDHHIHAAGCLHYTNPTEGVLAADMFRHTLGEDLKVGANLTWGPCFDYQKQFFTGTTDKVSSGSYLLRYDIEVSGFGSHESGHLCLLRLKDQMYPGGVSKDHWPKLGMNTLRWAKKQGALTGPAHSANGLEGSAGFVGGGENGPNSLPDYNIPAYNGIGANEYIVDVTHKVPGPDGKPVPAIDFISTMDTDRRLELNMWYHTLNCGFRVRASGETDFPCISGERVGMGRVYVKTKGKLSYDDWCEGIREGRSYVSDGRSHLMELEAVSPTGTVRKLGDKGSELRLAAPTTIKLRAKVSSRMVGVSETFVEVIVNGYPVARAPIRPDGTLQTMTFEVPIERSSWVALRIFPSAHTNPIFVVVGDKPIRASKRSAEWCLKGVEQCWSQKEQFYRGAERLQAEKDYEHARSAYRRIWEESAP